MSNTEIFAPHEKQFKHAEALKRLEILSKSFTNFDFDDKINKPPSAQIKPSSSRSSRKKSEIDYDYIDDDDEEYEDYDSNNVEEEDDGSAKTIDKIQKKIDRLNGLFKSFDLVKPVGDPAYYEKELDPKTKEEMLLTQQKEAKCLNLFSGIYSMKSVIYDLKTHIPPPAKNKNNTKQNEESNKNMPKLVELYQYRFTDYDVIYLPHDVKLDDILRKVIDSIFLLQRQLKYRLFVRRHYFSEPSKKIIHDTFWWCFLQKYQDLPSIQKEFFFRVSENYVKLIFTEMDVRYRDNFFTMYADLLAMSVYTIFCTCFPQSVLAQFTDEFKEFICQICHLWISGCKPTPNSFVTWNYKKLDPPEAVFAKEVLNKKKKTNVIEDILNNENINSIIDANNQTTNATSNMSINKSKKSTISSHSLNESQTNISMNSAPNRQKTGRQRRAAIVLSDLKKIAQDEKNIKTTRFFQSLRKKESHPAGKGPEFDNELFDLFGNSPLVEYYLYSKNARKINKAEILVQHANVIKLPPLNAVTYDDLIKESVKNIKKIEKSYKETSKKNENEYQRIIKENHNSMKEFHRNCDVLLSKNYEVHLMGDLIALNNSRDPNSTAYPIKITNE